jgi:hypothetical protein
MRQLALFASGDLAWIERLQLRLHVVRCPVCQEEVAGLARMRREVRDARDETPPGLDWDQLAAEMKANIRLGLAAGEIVSVPEPVTRHRGWQVAVAMGTVTALVMIAMTVTVLRNGRPSLPAGHWQATGGPLVILEGPRGHEVVLRATMGGIGVERNGQAMALTHGGTAAAVKMELHGSMQARYIDDDAGVTIHHVYSE